MKFLSDARVCRRKSKSTSSCSWIDRVELFTKIAYLFNRHVWSHSVTDSPPFVRVSFRRLASSEQRPHHFILISRGQDVDSDEQCGKPACISSLKAFQLVNLDPHGLCGRIHAEDCVHSSKLENVSRCERGLNISCRRRWVEHFAAVRRRHIQCAVSSAVIEVRTKIS